MNKSEAIKQIFGNRKILYFSREAERAIGLEGLIQNYYIASYEDSEFFDFLDSGKSFCLDREISRRASTITSETTSATDSVIHPALLQRRNPSAEDGDQKVSTTDSSPHLNSLLRGEISSGEDSKSSLSLIKNSLFEEWVRNNIGRDFYAATLFPSKPQSIRIEKLGGKLLANDFQLASRLENKIESAEILSSLGIPVPKFEIIQLDGSQNFLDITNSLKVDKIVLQMQKGHTGNSTFFVEDDEHFNFLKGKFAGNLVKVSEEIDGESLTINTCIYNSNYYVGPLQFQVTGQQPFTNSTGTTVGNDFSYGSLLLRNESLKFQLDQTIEKISKYLIQNEYKGIFGLDLIWNGEKVFVIEINARQTANMPFQTQLELMQVDQLPIMALHLASLMQIEIPLEYLMDYKNFSEVQGSQIFVRAKKDGTLVQHSNRSGEYRLQGDSSAWNIQDDSSVIFIDEHEDLPLIHKSNAYRLDQLENDGFLILFQKAGLIKNLHEELFRFQMLESSLVDGQVKPWIVQAGRKIEGMVGL